MKIFYGVQATGNGHISRAIQLLPHLQQYGEVDIFLSGSNSALSELKAKYSSRGLSLHYNSKGGLNFLKVLREVNLVRLFKEARSLPVQDYDLVFSDFECITAWACKLKNVPFLHLGHQASFASTHTPRPEKQNPIGEWVLKNYCRSAHNFAFHFQGYDSFIHQPIIKQEILDANPQDLGHITVYLTPYSIEVLTTVFSNFTGQQFHIFSSKVKQEYQQGSLHFFPISNNGFNESFINCSGIITGAGFETPAEALYLRKKLMCIPIGGQYEQLCNAEALKTFDVPIVKSILQDDFVALVDAWLNDNAVGSLAITKTIAESVVEMMEAAMVMMRIDRQ